jgi:hypothetical protein
VSYRSSELEERSDRHTHNPREELRSRQYPSWALSFTPSSFAKHPSASRPNEERRQAPRFVRLSGEHHDHASEPKENSPLELSRNRGRKECVFAKTERGRDETRCRRLAPRPRGTTAISVPTTRPKTFVGPRFEPLEPRGSRTRTVPYCGGPKPWQIGGPEKES